MGVLSLLHCSHIQILVKKLLSLSPSVILVSSNVSKHAIDLLLQVASSPPYQRSTTSPWSSTAL